MTISDAQIALQRRAARLVSQEVNACMSSLVATLAQGASDRIDDSGILNLADQAMELAAPVLDYESAAREAGWLRIDELDGAGFAAIHPDQELCEAQDAYCDTPAEAWEDACRASDIEPHECEVYEHWAVSTWLAEKLIAKGEKVDTDFAGLNVWARTTTGQAISMDSVIEAIVSETGYASGGEA